MAGIYIHIPFCKQACSYWDFHFSTNQSRKQELIEAIQKEVGQRADYLQNNLVETIYFGGGTPSLLSSSEINSLIETFHQNFKISDSQFI